MIMVIETKYSPGERIVTIMRFVSSTSRQCDDCNGRGTIALRLGPGVCPTCHGTRFIRHQDPPCWRVGKRLTIGQARVEITNSPDVETIFDNDYQPRSGRCESYMCVETGIGSGQTYSVDLLWPTEAEAQGECDRRNAVEGETT